MSELGYEYTEIDGVPVFWASAPEVRMSGTVMFRVGQSDEHLLARGTSHLIEHLALYPMSTSVIPYNGSTAQTLTSFTAQGDPDELGAHLTSVMGHVAALPYDRMDVESRVLRAEAAQRSGSLHGVALAYRYGPSRYGVIAYEELGLLHPQQAFVEQWRQFYFTRGNAAVFLTGPPPANLRFDALPEGDFRPVPVAVPLPQQLPARIWINSSGVALSFVLPRSVATTAALSMLQSILYAKLRGDLGMSYHVGIERDVWDAETSHWMLHADCRREESGDLAGLIQAEVSRLKLYGFPQSELDDYRAARARAKRDPAAAVGKASTIAHQWAVSRTTFDEETIDAEIDALTTVTVTQALSVACSTAMWVVPYGCDFGDLRLRDVFEWSTLRASGRDFHPATQPTDPEAPRDLRRVAVGADGVTLAHDVTQRSEGNPITVMWSSMVAAKQWADGWTFFGADGFTLTLRPADWADGAALEALIAGHVPRDRVVPTSESLVND